MVRRSVLRPFFSILALVILSVDCLAAGKPNIVLITLDATRADRMDFLGARKGLTPNLDSLARQGIIFSQAYAQAPLTVVSHATILTGTYPQIHRASDFGVPLPDALPYLPDLLHSTGYHTAAFVGSILLDPKNGPFQHYDRGFELFDAGFQQPERREGRYQTVRRQGDQVVARAIKWLAGNERGPFFLWVHLSDADERGETSYDRAIAVCDAAAGRLIRFLRSRPGYDEAMIVVASAYGESLGAHGEDGHGIFLYDETIRVPLLVKLPGNVLAGKPIKSRVRLLDIAPTILEAINLPVPPQMQGQSLLRAARSTSQADQPAYSRSELPWQGFGASMTEAWRTGKYLYIRGPKPELYDQPADPSCSHNLADSFRGTLATMAAQLESFDSRLGNDFKQAKGGLNPSEMQKLASLGYVGLEQSTAGVKAASEGIDPKDIIVQANRTRSALAALDDGQPERAIPTLRQVLATQPNIYAAQFAMGEALFQQQQYGEAIGYLHKAIELQPDSAWAHYQMGLSLIKTGDLKTAAVHLEIASGRLPGFVALHTTLADVYDHLGRNQEAVRERTATGNGNAKR